MGTWVSSRNRREEGGPIGNLTCWDRDKRRPGGQMTSCGRWRFWIGDGRCPGGRMKLCGRYGRDKSSRNGKVEYLKISDRVYGLRSH